MPQILSKRPNISIENGSSSSEEPSSKRSRTDSEPEEDLKCPTCAKAFKFKAALSFHITQKHPEEASVVTIGEDDNIVSQDNEEDSNNSFCDVVCNVDPLSLLNQSMDTTSNPDQSNYSNIEGPEDGADELEENFENTNVDVETVPESENQATFRTHGLGE